MAMAWLANSYVESRVDHWSDELWPSLQDRKDGRDSLKGMDNPEAVELLKLERKKITAEESEPEECP